MKLRTYLLISGTIFGLVAAAHLSRLVYQWPIVLTGRAVPEWVSWPGLVISGALSVWGFSLAARARE